jgi:tetratricopeptide (TPR) repeat protein
LPPHLRLHLGPRLADLLLKRDADAARMIRDAVDRTPDVPAGTVALIDAKAELQALRPEAALGHAETAVLEDGSGLPALAALVEAHFQSGMVLSPDVADSLRALRDVTREDAARRDRALLLALALSGQVDEALDLAGEDHPDGGDLWRAVTRHADDNAFLSHAVLGPEEPAPPVDADVALQIGARLASLGFPEAALNWLGPVTSSAAPEWRMAAATAELALGNARGTLLLLAGLSSPEALALQAAAYQQLGAFDAARQVLTSAGKVDEGNRLASWGGEWDVVKADGASAWAEAATFADPAPTPSAGPLAEGQAALDVSAAARSAISALLAEVPAPPP